jgi:hypothetical protein
MPLDAINVYDHRPGQARTQCLNDSERQAAAAFGPRLWAVLADVPSRGGPLVVLGSLSAGIAGAQFRLAPQGCAEAAPHPHEMAVARLAMGLPDSPAERRALTARIASAAAGAWRQRCQLQRLGLLAG